MIVGILHVLYSDSICTPRTMAPLRAIATLTCLAGGALSSPNVSQSHFQRYAAGQERVGNWSAAADDRHDARRQRAKNVILFIADGNGISSNYATRLWEGQHPPVNGFGDEHILAHEKMPYLALSKTYNTNAQTPDSAGTATALNSGVKTRSGILGLDENARNSRCEDVPISRVTSFAKTCKEMGKRVGIVTTARVTHATPGAVYAHSVNRNYEANVPVGCEEFQSDIAMQLIDEMIGATPMVDFALGGGREMFLPATASNTTTQASGQREGGVREDGINLVERFMAAGGAYANDRASFEALPLDASVPVLGLFQSSHMLYEHDRELQTNPEPSLKEMTVAAVQALEANNDQGYYLMVEGGRVDHANHAGNLFRTVTDGVAYQDAVQW
jgi:alkaline phosphatase